MANVICNKDTFAVRFFEKKVSYKKYEKVKLQKVFYYIKSVIKMWKQTKNKDENCIKRQN